MNDPLVEQLEHIKNAVLRVTALAACDQRVDAFAFMELLAAGLHFDRGLNGFATSIALSEEWLMTREEAEREAREKGTLQLILSQYLPMEHAIVARHKARQESIVLRLKEQLAELRKVAQ